MIRKVVRPEITPAFNVIDIHKIREWHYEILRDATVQERLDFYNRGATSVRTHDAGQAREETLDG